MKILVTGAAGKIGSALVHELLHNHHQVRALDKRALPDDLRGQTEMVYCELDDRLGVLRAAETCEAIAHLAAVPNPSRGEEEIFIPNVLGTQYVLAAAEANAIKKVVLASSCSAYGMAFARHEFDPQYLPVDENHPLLPQDLYGLSKQLNEQTAATYTRRCGMATTCLRLPAVMSFNAQRARWMRRMPDRAIEWKSRDLWGYLEVRDAARAFRLALENVESGHHVAICAARDVLGNATPRELVARHYPDLERFLDGFDSSNGLWVTQKAEELFGFVAQISWRDALAQSEE